MSGPGIVHATLVALHESGIGTFETLTDVRYTAAFGGKPDIKRTSQKGRVCRVGPGPLTPSLSQIRT